MIKTKSTGQPASKRDGLRIFATRYWPRGHRRDECDEWIPNLAPSEALLHRIQIGEISWTVFAREYKHEMRKGWCDESARNLRMRNSGQRYLIRLLRKIAEQQTVTILCTCPPDAKQCHRFLLQSLLES